MPKKNNLKKTEIALALVRIFLGVIFLWAFFDKLVGLGFTTCRDSKIGNVEVLCDKAWINGGSPTYGFLKFATAGPFKQFYASIAGNIFVDWIFMLGLLGIGTALTLGIGMNVATYSGIAFFILMWSSVLPPQNNPLIDEHIIYSFVLLILKGYNAGDYFGLGKKWKKLNIIKNNKWLE